MGKAGYMLNSQWELYGQYSYITFDSGEFAAVSGCNPSTSDVSEAHHAFKQGLKFEGQHSSDAEDPDARTLSDDDLDSAKRQGEQQNAAVQAGKQAPATRAKEKAKARAIRAGTAANP